MSNQESKRPKLIGLSLSWCCEEIAEGKVEYDDVKLIITRTSARTPEQFEKMIQEYRKYYWFNPATRNKAARLARKLYREGKLEQPRITHGRCPKGRYPIWVTNRKKIEWKEEHPTPA
ncbi:MAG: hypothetical protein NTV02_03610 [Candidatus Zambryskibacteria bacterium]|nr:hypothetical protein [Candidatus Zambryskibacteria bacterium]